LFALLLIGPISQVQGKAQAAEPKNSANHRTQDAERSPVIVNDINPQKSQQDAANEQAKENREERRKDIELYLTGAIVIAAVFQALFAALQWIIYRHQLKTSMPLVIIDWENYIHIAPLTLDNFESGPKALVHHFNWGVRNVGPTPAFIVETSAKFVIVPSSEGIPKMDYADPEPYIGEPLFTEPKPVGGMNFYVRIADNRPYAEIETAYRGGKETLYAFGYVRFRDRYGKNHTTRFCVRYYAWREMRKEVDGFGVAGKKQNQYS